MPLKRHKVPPIWSEFLLSFFCQAPRQNLVEMKLDPDESH